MEYASASAQETQDIAAVMAHQAWEQKPDNQAVVIGLEGDLGAGKTTFVQGFLKALKVADKVKSPTFLLIKQYVLGDRNVYHLDCYRISNSQELLPLEIDQILKDPANIVLVEWPECIADILPSERTTITFQHISDHERKIIIS